MYSASIQAQNADSAAFYLQKGNQEKEARRYREAEKNFVKANGFAPGNSEIILNLADAYLLQNRYAEARERFLEVEKTTPGNPVAIENLATLSYNLRKWDDAIKYARKMQEMKINKPANFIIGKSFYEKEDYGEAIKALNQAGVEEPTRAETFYILGRCYLDMSNYKQSGAQFEKAIALDSSKFNWIYEASLVFYAIPDYKKSLQYMELAGEKGYNKNNDYYQNLGNAYMNVKQYEKAIETYLIVLKRKPSDLELLYQVAQAHYKAGKYQEAIDYWDQVLTNDKSNANALYMIGLSYQKKGEKDKGMQLCDKAIEMDPSLSSLRQKQGEPTL